MYCILKTVFDSCCLLMNSFISLSILFLLHKKPTFNSIQTRPGVDIQFSVGDWTTQPLPYKGVLLSTQIQPIHSLSLFTPAILLLPLSHILVSISLQMCKDLSLSFIITCATVSKYFQFFKFQYVYLVLSLFLWLRVSLKMN